MKTIKIKAAHTSKTVAKVAGLLFCTGLFGLTLAPPSEAGEWFTMRRVKSQNPNQAVFQILVKKPGNSGSTTTRKIDSVELDLKGDGIAFKPNGGSNVVEKDGKITVNIDQEQAKNLPDDYNFDKPLAELVFEVMGEGPEHKSTVSARANYTNYDKYGYKKSSGFSKANSTHAPEPLTILGSAMGAGGLIWLKKRRSEKDKLA